MDVQKFKELYTGKFHCQKTWTLGLLTFAASQIDDSEEIKCMAGFYGFNQNPASMKTSAGILTITNKNLYYFTAVIPLISIPFESGIIPLRNIDSIEITGGFRKYLTARIANVPYNFSLIDHPVLVQTAILNAQEELKKN